MIVPELLAPAGDLTKLKVALAYGADAVYAGAAGFSMRPDSASLSVEGMREALALTHAAGKRLYAALNSMLFEAELPAVEVWLRQMRGAGLDGLIVSDPGVFALARRLLPDVPLHISTQLSTANREAALFWRLAGATRVILARECDLQTARSIAAGREIETEIFAHGAMCMAVSGRCLMSAHLAGHSASRGECKHACRWEYQLVEESRPGQTVPVFETGRETIFLGSRDLCLIEHIPALCDTGAAALKIEGRMKSEYYLAATVRIYRAALDAYAAHPEGWQADPAWLAELCSASHRPFCSGFAFGYPQNERGRMQCNNKYAATHEYCGYVTEQGGIQVKNPFAPFQELEYFTPQGGTGVVRCGRICSVDGTEWPLARPGNEVRAEYSGGRLPAWTMLRRPAGVRGE